MTKPKESAAAGWWKLTAPFCPDPDRERRRLETQSGQVWSTVELAGQFDVMGFLAPYVVVRRKSDGFKGSLELQHSPRFYFNFERDPKAP